MICNTQKLLGVLKEKGFTQDALAEKTGMSRATLNRRIKNNGDDFTIKEIEEIRSALELSSKEAITIFLCPYSPAYETDEKKGE